MPKIQQSIDKKKGKEYPKYSVNIPNWVMEKQKWKKGTKLGFTIKKDEVIIKSFNGDEEDV